MMRTRDAREHGFTLIELMVVLLVIGILIAIAIPIFLGSRNRAEDRRTQADLRTAFTAEKLYYSDGGKFTDNPAWVAEIEPALTYDKNRSVTAPGVISLEYKPATDDIFLGAMSRSGTCFYLHAFPDQALEFAKSTSCVDVDVVTYGTAW